VSDFKVRFKALKAWIQSRGGLEYINQLKVVNPEGGRNDSDIDAMNYSIQTNKISIRGGLPTHNPKES